MPIMLGLIGRVKPMHINLFEFVCIKLYLVIFSM